ncbi:MAG TPA: TOBE domain-containing protein, partial [Acetobacteraceae bacterium]|nr:TOBE domain-containing protein [Acetobacteraceae bacterium]
RFVADFIGTSNLIEGRVAAAQGGKIVFEADAGGQLQAEGEAAVGARGALCIRPEKIDLVPPGSGRALPATVVRAVRVGGLMEYAVALANGPELIVQEQLRHGVAAHGTGDGVSVLLRPEHARFLAG